MPIVDDFQLPASAQGLQFPNTPTSTTKFFVLFLSSTDPATKQPWCSDVRAALPLLNATFTSETSPNVHYVYVGLKPEYKSLDNRYRKCWNIHCVPALVRYESRDSKVEETGRLIEGELLDRNRVYDLVGIL